MVMFCDLYILRVPLADSVRDYDEQIMEKYPLEVKILLFADNFYLTVSRSINATTKIPDKFWPFALLCQLLDV